MNIAQVVLNLDLGGLEKMALDLACAEKRAGHKTFIYSVTHPGALAGQAEGLGIPVRAFHKTHGLSPRVILQMAKQFRRDAIDVVHTHNAVIHHYGAVAGRIARVPIILNTQHGLAGKSQPRLIKLFSAVASLTDAVVFVAAETERTFRSQAPSLPKRTCVIPNGIEVQALIEHAATPGAHRPRIRFGTIGRMAPVKDHANLLRAFSRLAATHPAAELHLMGYGELRNATVELARTVGIADRFFLHAPDDSTPEFLESLDVFAISSRSEALPISLLEAMAAALPIVSTRVGGIPDVAPEGEVAWFCPPEDSTALSAILSEAADSPELSARGRKAQEIVIRKYSADVMAARYLDLIAEIRQR